MKVALCWHMHQPYYRDELHGEYSLPWVYLHAIKDYSDMAWHLEQNPKMRLVVNFTPVLLEQLLDYEQRVAAFIERQEPMNDPLLNLLAGVTPIPQTAKERQQIIANCRRCNAATMITPWPAYRELVEHADNVTQKATYPGACRYFSHQYFYDLLTWYHLTWLGHSLKQDKRARRLLDKAVNFTADDRMDLLQIIYECLRDIIPRYKALADRDQIEISMTPWGHPIVPLLHDFSNMSCAQPDAPHPQERVYPAGHERTHWHMQQGIAFFESCFGRKPNGVWLPEGGLSQDALELLDEFEIKWTASGESVWRNSASLSHISKDDIDSKRGLFQAYRSRPSNVRMFFRDDGLSDLIGFEYRGWSAKDAVANFSSHIGNISKFLGDDADDHLISVILDGENAWEYFPDNAFHFLRHFYHEMVNNEQIEPITLNEACAQLPCAQLEHICPGSWVYGTFSTWIGEQDKNRAWDLLVQAKRCYDNVLANKQLDEERATQLARQLAICEGSDWFWWFGEHNAAESVHDFDNLYRHQLRMFYKLLDMPPPPSLNEPISSGNDSPAWSDSGAMRRNVG